MRNRNSDLTARSSEASEDLDERLAARMLASDEYSEAWLDDDESDDDEEDWFREQWEGETPQVINPGEQVALDVPRPGDHYRALANCLLEVSNEGL